MEYVRSRRGMPSAPREVTRTRRKTEPATCRVAKWAPLKVEWSGVGTCPLTVTALGVGTGAATRVHRH